MQTDDASNLFQTDAALAKSDARRSKAQRASKIGDPISLPSKILALEVRGQDAWVAESGWVARRVDLIVSRRGEGGWGCTNVSTTDGQSEESFQGPSRTLYISRILRSSSTGQPLLHGFLGQNNSNMEYRGVSERWLNTYRGLTSVNPDRQLHVFNTGP